MQRGCTHKTLCHFDCLQIIILTWGSSQVLLVVAFSLRSCVLNIECQTAAAQTFFLSWLYNYLGEFPRRQNMGCMKARCQWRVSQKPETSYKTKMTNPIATPEASGRKKKSGQKYGIINCEGVTNRIRVPTQGACMLALQKQNPALENNLSTELVAAAGTRFLAAATSYTTLKS